MYKKLTITTIILILMCITVSFAWMMDVVGPSGNAVVFDYENALYVSSNNLEINISVEQNEQYIPLYRYIEGEKNLNTLAVFDNKAPGDTIKFSINIKNTSDLEVTVSVLFSEILASHQDFLEFMEVGVISFSGMRKYKDSPIVEEFAIKDRITDYENFVFDPEKSISINFLNNLKIPVGEEGVNIKFYIRLSTKAENTLQNQTFKIGKINFISA